MRVPLSDSFVCDRSSARLTRWSAKSTPTSLWHHACSNILGTVYLHSLRPVHCPSWMGAIHFFQMGSPTLLSWTSIPRSLLVRIWPVKPPLSKCLPVMPSLPKRWVFHWHQPPPFLSRQLWLQSTARTPSNLVRATTSPRLRRLIDSSGMGVRGGIKILVIDEPFNGTNTV